MVFLTLALAVIVGCASPGRPVTQPVRPPTAVEIVNKLKARYAAAKTYADRGFVVNGTSIRRSFDTTFVRGARFRFDLRDDNTPRHGFVIWADPTHTYSRWYGPPRTTDDGPGLAVAIAVATRPSLGVVQTLAHLLQPDAVPGTELADIRLDGTETIDERPCWVISGKRGDSAAKLWIDRESFVLRKSAEDSDVATFLPVLDAPIDVATIAPPDFSDDYEDGSPMLAAARALVSTRAPGFDAAIVNGPGRVTLAALAGHVVVVDFWATWCGPCRMTLPRLDEWHHEYAARGLRIVGLSSEDTDVIGKLATEQGLDYTIARDENAATSRTYNVAALPMLVVIDRGGVVRYVTLGAGNLDAVEAVIESLLASK